jgi:hypothetical protein
MHEAGEEHAAEVSSPSRQHYGGETDYGAGRGRFTGVRGGAQLDAAVRGYGEFADGQAHLGLVGHLNGDYRGIRRRVDVLCGFGCTSTLMRRDD